MQQGRKAACLISFARLRTPSSPDDTTFRLGARVAVFSPAFLLARALPSATSAEAGASLFGGFSGTTTLSDSRFVSASILRVLSFIDATLLPLARELAGSPDSRAESVYTCCRSLTPPKPATPRLAVWLILHSLSSNKVCLRIEVISELNTAPVLSPVNASPRPCGLSRHDSEL